MTSRVSQASRSLKNKFQGPAQPQGLKRLASNAGQAARTLKNKFQGPAQASNASQAARALKNRLQQDFVVKPICSTQIHAITREAVFRNTVKLMVLCVKPICSTQLHARILFVQVSTKSNMFHAIFKEITDLQKNDKSGRTWLIFV